MAKQSRRTSSPKPCLLFVDDNLEEAEAKRGLIGSRATTIARTPDDVTRNDLKCADVVLVDFVLTDWLESDRADSLAKQPKDGLALAAVLRSHCEATWPPTAFALHSARVQELAGGLPPRSRAHVIARTNNLEWVFSKRNNENVRPVADQVLALAEAVGALPTKWPSQDLGRMRRSVERLLRLNAKSDWAQRAWRTVESCHPPIHTLAAATHGLAFVRWLLHQILPFPSFLWDSTYLAARLRVTPKSLRSALSTNHRLARVLAPYRYRGILSDFLGSRWWRAGVEELLWRRTGSQSFTSDALTKFISDLSPTLQPTTVGEPVVVLGEDLQPSDELIDISDAVELQPDEWPAFADTAWGEKAVVDQNKSLQSIVVRRELPES